VCCSVFSFLFAWLGVCLFGLANILGTLCHLYSMLSLCCCFLCVCWLVSTILGTFLCAWAWSVFALLFACCFISCLLACFLGTFLFNTNHIFIGVVYIVIGLVGGSLGFGLSIIIRLELGLPGFNNVSSLNYNSVITFHGLLMIFFMIMPILIGGFGNCLIPILLSCNDMIFPRLNLLSLWLSMFSLILIMLSLVIDSGVNAG